jgi:alpha-beta hydrolase superfamily lysophospholipase
MKRTTLLFSIFLFLFSTISRGQYSTDVLGAGFETQTIQMPDDAQGKVVCTIVRHRSKVPTAKAVLYIHGFCDYFFNRELAEAYTTNDFDFYAIDLRKYGRSYLKNQDINSCRSLEEYFPDIDTALAIIKAEGHNNITINAHSTGGLTTVLYAKAHQQNKKYNKIVLNSPFLSMNQSWFKEHILIPVMSFLGRFFPNITLPKGLSGLYGETISKSFRGEWEYNADWKPIIAFPMDAGWLRAIHLGHLQVEEGLNLNDSILVLSSGKSIYGEVWSEDFRHGDAVLDVSEIQSIGKNLSQNATIEIIEGGLHDLGLSELTVRKNYFNKIVSY